MTATRPQQPSVELVPVQPLELRPVGAQGEVVLAPPPPDWRAAARRRVSFLLLCALPTFLVTFYLFVFAADQYVSEAQFLVRGTNAGSVAAELQGIGMTRSSDETQIVVAFMQSGDIVRELEADISLKAMYARPEADWLSRFPKGVFDDNMEMFVRHFQYWTNVRVDESSGITTLRAYAYRATDAIAIARGMIARGEKLVNRINERAYDDKVSYARSIVDKARADVARVEKEMTEFRNRTGTVDLGKETTSALQMIGSMNAELAQLEAGLKQQMAVTPNGPGIASTRHRIASYKSEIAKLQRKVVGESSSLATELGQYERLMLERGLVARALEAATAEFDKARQEAQIQHFYLVRVTEPNLADSTDYPRRWMWSLVALTLSYLLYRTLRAVVGVMREHRP